MKTEFLLFAVTGGRRFADAAAVDRAMRKYVRPGDRRALVLEGGASGADLLVRQWCQQNGVHSAEVPALWSWNGKAAGPIRNGVMLLPRPEFVLAFPGGVGTADMCSQAESAGIPVYK